MKKVYPIYLNKKSPCYSLDHKDNYGCPAHSDIARFLYSINIGEQRQAFEILKETNPFSGGCGRFCDHPCETACNRGKFDEPVDIKYLERFASDYGFNNNIMAEPVKDRKDKSIAVIGSGPAGLSTAYFLAREGYDVIVYERHGEPGGILTQGIPIFRYPVAVRDYEIRYIQSYGVRIECNVHVDSDFLLKLIQEHDGVVIATGAQKPRLMGIPGDDLPGVVVGFEFLRKMHFDSDFKRSHYDGLLEKLGVGKKVAVIGGGYTAFDVARSVVRLGAEPVVYYRRGIDEMTAHPGEVQEANHEGVQFQFLIAPSRVRKHESGQLEMTMQKMWLGDPDSSGRRRPQAEHGSEHPVLVDTIITAIGETPELELIPGDYKIAGYQLVIDQLAEPMRSKVYITGDALQGKGNVTGMVVRAVGMASDTSIQVRKALGEDLEEPSYYSDVAFYDTIKTRYFNKEARVRIDKLPYEARIGNFNEVDIPLSEELAVEKAGRCWNCGICIQCDWCRDYSNQAILKLSIPWNPGKTSHFYKFLMEKIDWSTRESVTGCPRNAMGMVPYDDQWKDLVDKQYISFDSIKY